jgi:hypothetical protein
MPKKTKEEVKAYASEHKLEQKLSEAVNAAVQSDSPDPVAFIASLLSRKASDKGDYDAVREELKLMMDNSSWDDGSLAPLFIRLAWHSSGTYDEASKTGGSNGAGMRFNSEASDPENAGLHTARAFLEPLRKKFPAISFSDLWVLAAYVGIEHTGGPAIPFTPGRVDYADESAPTYPPVGRLPGAEKYIKEGVDADGRANGWQALCGHIRDEVFYRMGVRPPTGCERMLASSSSSSSSPCPALPALFPRPETPKAREGKGGRRREREGDG